MNLYKIAGHVIALNWDVKYIHDNMKEFACENEEAEVLFEMEQEVLQIEPTREPLIRSSYLTIYQAEEDYLLFYSHSGIVNSCRYNPNTSVGTIYITKELNDETATLTSTSNLNLTTVDYIFFAIRDAFFIFMQSQGILAVHSSSLIYKDQAFLFSASSGTGKTTHTDMWVERYGVDILDGDVTAVCIEDDQPIAYGLPWCGTSKRFLNRRVILGGVVFLSQSCHNSVSNLSFFEATVRLAARCFTPTWTKELTNYNFVIAETLVPKIICCYLGCLPNQEAVDTVKAYIDSRR